MPAGGDLTLTLILSRIGAATAIIATAITATAITATAINAATAIIAAITVLLLLSLPPLSLLLLLSLSLLSSHSVFTLNLTPLFWHTLILALASPASPLAAIPRPVAVFLAAAAVPLAILAATPLDAAAASPLATIPRRYHRSAITIAAIDVTVTAATAIVATAITIATGALPKCVPHSPQLIRVVRSLATLTSAVEGV